jgi:hypothetical protein
MGIWSDLTKNPTTKHYVAKDVFRTLSFVAGLLLCFVVAAADVYGGGREVSAEPALFLLAFALGAQGLKQYEVQQNRRTADENGNPLAVPDPPADPPPIMRQVPNPNAPISPGHD